VTTLPGSPPPNQDDPLADFVDHIRMDGSANIELSSDEELRGLEETLLRFDRAFPREIPSEETVKRMQADFGIRRRRLAASERADHQTWWRFLFRSPITMTVVVSVVVGMLVLLTPSLTDVGSSMSGAAGMQTKPIGFLLALGIILILLTLWSHRRK